MSDGDATDACERWHRRNRQATSSGAAAQRAALILF
jgi:hypothetical protein